MALKGKRARRAAGLHGRREYENIFLLWQNKEFLETEVFKDYPACITQMGVLYMPIMVLSIFAAGSMLTHLLSFPSLPLSTDSVGAPTGRTHLHLIVPHLCLLIFISSDATGSFVYAALGERINYPAPSFITVQTLALSTALRHPVCQRVYMASISTLQKRECVCISVCVGGEAAPVETAHWDPNDRT